MPWLDKLGGDAALAAWVAVAVLVEAALYASMAREAWRRRWQRRMLVAAAPLSCALYHVGLDWSSLPSVLGLGAMAAFFVGLSPVLARRRHGWLWVAALAAAPVLLKAFRLFYPPAGELRMEFLGQLMWIRTTVLTVLRDLQPEGIGFGFWPGAREWKTGLLYFVLLMPAAFAAAWLTGFARPAWPGEPWLWTAGKAAATFFGILWVVALSEEFFFRGLLQPRIGLWAASALFGLAHLGFREFPNWRFAVVAAVAGVFYGLAFRAGGGIRASMVTHALTVAAWRTFFR
ncbi:MAG: CPBP family intramembrane metalloprotease [Bryobacteraceae bacterium]|nr:CPBP family intramembrane metalloprotease [Bryobacteraceae bacterium]